MASETVTQAWFGSFWRIPKKGATETDKPVIGILAFEVMSLMNKVINLWHSLSDHEVIRLREEIVNSVGIRKLVAEDDNYLMDLALDEIIENLGIVARSAARLGKKCADPIYHRFEHFIKDPLNNNFEWLQWCYRLKKMERKLKKMEKFVAATMQLSQELEVLAELEQTLRRMKANADTNKVKLLEFQQKVTWQRQEIKNLRDMSPWNRTYDYVVRLLIRSLFTILKRIKLVFRISEMGTVRGNNVCQKPNAESLSRSLSFSAARSLVYPSENNGCGFSSGPLGRSISKSRLSADKNRTNNTLQQAYYHSYSLRRTPQPLKAKRFAHVGPFKGCVISGSDSPIIQRCKPREGGSMRYNSVYMENIDGTEKINTLADGCRIYSKLSKVSSKHDLLRAPPFTLGNSALALHYANVIILIEKLALAPHLVSFDARDDLYNMLPSTLKSALRSRLKSYSKTLGPSVYNASLAYQWSRALVCILEWLAPLAHNMIRWQSEHNFEKQREECRSNVLLVQTLYFANQIKTEAAIMELLVGLNYMCRIGRGNGQIQPGSASSRAYNYGLLKTNNPAHHVTKYE